MITAALDRWRSAESEENRTKAGEDVARNTMEAFLDWLQGPLCPAPLDQLVERPIYEWLEHRKPRRATGRLNGALPQRAVWALLVEMGYPRAAEIRRPLVVRHGQTMMV